MVEYIVVCPLKGVCANTFPGFVSMVTASDVDSSYFLCAVFIFSHNTCTIIRQKNTSHQGLLICSIFKSLQSFVFDIFLCFYNTVTCPFYIHVHVINTVHFTIAKTHGK